MGGRKGREKGQGQFGMRSNPTTEKIDLWGRLGGSWGMDLLC